MVLGETVNPLLAMRDLTKVSGKKEMGRALTLSVARGVEVRPLALALSITGIFIGLVFALLTFHFLGPLPGAALAIALGLFLPAVFLGTGKDKQVRARRMARALESRGMEGKAFFAGSLFPGDLEEARVFYP